MSCLLPMEVVADDGKGQVAWLANIDAYRTRLAQHHASSFIAPSTLTHIPAYMPPKRLRRASPHSYGLSAGERLKRAKLAGNDYLAWSWVGSEVTEPSQITQEHRLATCGFSDLNPYPFCANKYPVASKSRLAIKREEETSAKVEGELEDDIIVVSDDESPACTSKGCKSNPNCLNYIGQEKWENEGRPHSTCLRWPGCKVCCVQRKHAARS